MSAALEVGRVEDGSGRAGSDEEVVDEVWTAPMGGPRMMDVSAFVLDAMEVGAVDGFVVLDGTTAGSDDGGTGVGSGTDGVVSEAVGVSAGAAIMSVLASWANAYGMK